MLSIEVASSEDRERWNNFVREQKVDHFAHLFEWREIISEVFRHKPIYLIALRYSEEKKADVIAGVLPLFLVRSRLFGSSLISAPYLNGGGILAKDDAAFEALLARVHALKAEHKVRYVELRSRVSDSRYVGETGFPLPVRTHKVAMQLPLPKSEEELLKNFDKKLRSQIKRPGKEGVTTKITSGSEAALDDFYSVFAENMRDLGTPVYPRKFWSPIFKHLGKESKCIVAYLEEKPVAASITIGSGEFVEIPWASSLKAFNKVSANMLLYFDSMNQGIRDGFKFFDFGRSTKDSGTFKFKEQWGASPKTLYWYYIAALTDVPDVNPKKFSLLVSVWKKLPLSVANLLGPFITKSLP